MSSVSAAPVELPAAERCIIYCMTCQRSTTAATFVIEGLFGYLPYGFLTGRLHCKKGCGDRFGVVLPVDAPTPRAFVNKYGRPPAPVAQPNRLARALDEDMKGSLVEIGDGGSFVKIHARAEDPEILHFGFDHLLAKLSQNGNKPPHLAVTRGAQWSRDSQRDFKVVPAIPYEAPRGPARRPEWHSTPHPHDTARDRDPGPS